MSLTPKEKQKRYRNKNKMENVTESNEMVTESPKSVTEESVTVTESVTIPDHLMSLVVALSDINKRAKLRAICEMLSNKGLLRQVRYGVKGANMGTCAELLEAF